MALKAWVPSLTFGRANALPCRRDCSVEPAAMQLNSLILRFINKPSIKKNTWDCLPQHISSVIWRGLNIPANLLSISTPAVAAPSAQRGAAFRPPLMWRPDARQCCASWTDRRVLRDDGLCLITSRVYTDGIKFPWRQRRRWCWVGWNKAGVTCYAIYTEQVDNCLKVRQRAKHKQAFCDCVCACVMSLRHKEEECVTWSPGCLPGIQGSLMPKVCVRWEGGGGTNSAL